MPHEQTMPLLTHSQLLIGVTLHPNVSATTTALGPYRNQNTSNGLLTDWEMRMPRPPYEPMSTIMDLGEVPVDMKLLQLRNPRVHPPLAVYTKHADSQAYASHHSLGSLDTSTLSLGGGKSPPVEPLLMAA